MRKSSRTDQFGRGPMCLIISRQNAATYSIVTSTTETTAKYEGSNQNRVSTPTAVLDYPAVSVYRPNQLNDCFVVVDVAGGQSVQAQTDDDTGTPIDQICASAQSLANTAMTNLLAQN